MHPMLRTLIVPAMAAVLVACGGEPESETGLAAAGDTATAAPAPPAAQPGTVAADAGLLNPETASREELMTVEGIDAVVADAIIAGRPYQDMTEVEAVLAAHVDEAGREQIYRRMWKPIDLNNASDEEILLIPGVGERMRHEFDEYRPYRAMEQFRREIGKYVDEEEVARLEQYVEIR